MGRARQPSRKPKAEAPARPRRSKAGERYRERPADYCRERLKVALTPDQEAIAGLLVQPPYKVLVRAAHNVGPSCPACGKGGPCSCPEPAAGGALPDYASMPSITVVCADAAKRQRVLDDLASSPSLAAFKEKFGPRARGYDPGHWHLKPFKLAEDRRFQASGFCILVQGVADPGGKARPTVVYDYEGPDQLAGVLRTVDPSYDPNRLTPAAVTDNLPAAASVAVGLLTSLAALLFPSRKNA